VRRWVVSDGPGAVWFRDEHGAPASVLPPPVREVSATGSGDVLHAVLLAALFLDGQSLPAAVARAIPFAAANAAHAGIAEFRLPI
jgi:1-phosphofructokinase/tagatose 6-phosphate kinase